MTSHAVPGLSQEVRRYGRFDVNACLSCGGCTVVCDLANGSASFPRKPIRRALLGLKDSLLSGLEPWLCHDCGDCSIVCPRQAEPRESMMTLRRWLAGQYDLTHLSSKILTSRMWETLAISFTAALVFILVLIYHLYYVQLSISDFVSTPMGLEHMFGTITYFTYAVFLIPLLVIISNAVRMYRFTMQGGDATAIPLRLYLVEAGTMFLHMVSHKNIRKCVQAIHKQRWTQHWLMGLAVTLKCVIVVFFLSWFQTDAIYPVYHPQRLVGYFIAAVLIYVPAAILVSRAKKSKEMHKFSEFSDLTLPIMLLIVAVTGLMVHVLRYLDFQLASHYAYALHLAVAVPLVVVELPFSKWSHVIYRPLALYFQAVKERALKEAELISGKEPAKEFSPGETQVA